MFRAATALVFVSLALLVGLLVIAPKPVFAASEEHCVGANKPGGSPSLLGFPTWYKYLNPTFENGQCNIDAPFPESIGKILLAVFEILLRLTGILAVGFVIWGGFQYILSQGEPERSGHARTTIINALIGLAIAVSAVAIVNLIGRNLA